MLFYISFFSSAVLTEEMHNAVNASLRLFNYSREQFFDSMRHAQASPVLPGMATDLPYARRNDVRTRLAEEITPELESAIDRDGGIDILTQTVIALDLPTFREQVTRLETIIPNMSEEPGLNQLGATEDRIRQAIDQLEPVLLEAEPISQLLSARTEDKDEFTALVKRWIAVLVRYVILDGFFSNRPSNLNEAPMVSIEHHEEN